MEDSSEPFSPPGLPVNGASMPTSRHNGATQALSPGNSATLPQTPSAPTSRGTSILQEAPAGLRGEPGLVTRVNAAQTMDPTTANADDSETVLSAMATLFESLNEVHLEGEAEPWKPSIKAGDGFKACKQFLCALSAAADALQIRPQSREYRHQFTKNYRALFPDQRRHYRVDVLEASQEGYTLIYVNGERFDFHSSVIESGVNFKLAWINTIEKLHQLQRQDLVTYQYWRSELVPVLVDLDCKWADFEQEYILELIQIERKARRYVMDVISLENQLIYLDSSVATLVAKGDASVQTAHLHIWQQWQSCRREYVKKMFRLNSIANYRRKGRGDLDLSVLETAENIIKTSESQPGHVYECVSSIAGSCVASFNDFRKHITELAQTPERIDPHLCNNVALVNHLVRVEETWELAQKYLMDAQRLRNVIHIVDFIVAVVKTQKAILAILNPSSSSSPNAGGSSGAESSKPCKDSNQTVAGASPFPGAGGPNLALPARGNEQGTEEGARSASLGYTDSLSNGKQVGSPEAKPASVQDSPLGGGPASCSSIRATNLSRHRTSSSHGADKRETLEEKLIACDVEAFLALPRFVCLYYLLDPIHRSQILQQFLPHYFVESTSTADPMSDIPDDSCGQKPVQLSDCVSSLTKFTSSLSALQTPAPDCGNARLLHGTENSSASSASSSQSNISVCPPPDQRHSTTPPDTDGPEAAGVAALQRHGSASMEDNEDCPMDAQGGEMNHPTGMETREDFRFLSSFSGDATTTRAPSRFSSQLGEESSSFSSSSSAFPSAPPASSSTEWPTMPVKPSPGVSPDIAGAVHSPPMETESDVSTMCGSILRDSVSSTSALQQSAREIRLGAGVRETEDENVDLSATRGPATEERGAVSSHLCASDHDPARSPSPRASSLGNATGVGVFQQRKGQRVFFCNSQTSGYAQGACAPLSLGNGQLDGAQTWIQQQSLKTRYILSKVPPGLRKMVKTWLVLQSWLRSEGLEDCKEAWLCVIARLADSDDFKLLLQKWTGANLVGFRHQLEALFQAVEEISMALQRSSPQDWNEFLQAIIQGIERDSPQRRSVC
uniref:Phospho-2-dehydro-3-deoxyheptonate aldolase,related n=1 Tax=Neospora caninum (strain Liverpool) TaxID=572307 RepID=A0A0F7U7I9_NEOCL|nr:TPA: Phospho-2-dehydro-3-deoxyheptonate aldolase,related [Neospora caninum Liverpool]